MRGTLAPKTAASRRTGGWLVFASMMGLLLAGCIDGDNAAPDDPEALTFEPGLGPGHVDPLIELTHDAEQDAAAVLFACRNESDLVECANEHLKSIVGAEGSMYAFDVLEAMTGMDVTIQRMEHPIAHVLGRHALYVYGTIGETLITCSHKVFQGCIHGALQEYFEHVELSDADLEAVCPPNATEFEIYACMHGLGHGLVLATGYDLPRSLELCASLERSTDRANCYGGAFMENVVAHNDHIRAGGTFEGHGRDPQTQGDNDDPHAHHGHHDHGDHHAHGGDTLPDFWVDPDDLQFPCNAIDEEFQSYCWRMQTSLILFLNGGDFQEAAQICGQLDGGLHESCYRSLGRDASSWGKRDAAAVANYCSNVDDPDNRSHCIHGAIAEVVTNWADPEAGLPFCAAYPEQDRPMCYEGLGRAALNHLDPEGRAALCAMLENGYEDDCRAGARLE